MTEKVMYKSSDVQYALSKKTAKSDVMIQRHSTAGEKAFLYDFQALGIQCILAETFLHE